MRIAKIVSDGTAAGTLVFDEQGNRVQGVTAVLWQIGEGGRSQATITVVDVALGAEGKAE